MKKVISKKGFSLVELIIALSILIIMTGVAILYLGDVLYKAKVAKAATDIEILIEALTLNDTENPTSILDSGLAGSVSTATLGGFSLNERDTLAKLVGSYLLSLPNDPWGANYKVNSYAGWVKSLGENLIFSGTTKYDQDVVGYFLPENLFLAKVRASDLNENAALDSGDEIRLYFSKSVKCNVKSAAADPVSIRGGAGIDTTVDGSDASVLTETGDFLMPAAGISMAANTAAWDFSDLMAYAPGETTADACLSRSGVTPAEVYRGMVTSVNTTTAVIRREEYIYQNDGQFKRPLDTLYYLSAFSRDLVFTVTNAAVTGMHLDIGYDVYIPTGYSGSYNMSKGYAIWESTKGYASYKTEAEKSKIYLQVNNPISAKRKLVWKSIVD